MASGRSRPRKGASKGESEGEGGEEGEEEEKDEDEGCILTGARLDWDGWCRGDGKGDAIFGGEKR